LSTIGDPSRPKGRDAAALPLGQVSCAESAIEVGHPEIDDIDAAIGDAVSGQRQQDAAGRPRAPLSMAAATGARPFRGRRRYGP
jgi:hypothetical protein